MAIPAETYCRQFPVYTFLVVNDGLTFCFCPLSQRREKFTLINFFLVNKGETN